MCCCTLGCSFVSALLSQSFIRQILRNRNSLLLWKCSHCELLFFQYSCVLRFCFTRPSARVLFGALMKRLFDTSRDFREDDEDDSKDALLQSSKANANADLDVSRADGKDTNRSASGLGNNLSLSAGFSSNLTTDMTLNSTIAGLSSVDPGDRMIKRKTRAFEELTLVVANSRRVSRLCFQVMPTRILDWCTECEIVQSPELMTLILNDLKSMAYLHHYCAAHSMQFCAPWSVIATVFCILNWQLIQRSCWRRTECLQLKRSSEFATAQPYSTFSANSLQELNPCQRFLNSMFFYVRAFLSSFEAQFDTLILSVLFCSPTQRLNVIWIQK